MQLLDAPEAAVVTVLDVTGDLPLRLRLAELGIRVGESIGVGQRTSGGGRVIRVAESRIAVDRTTAARIRVQLPPDGAAG